MAQHKWWQQAVFYQVYPRSFADGNGDGIGDFPGIIARLDYLRDLGVDAIWLSPHYPSPFLDCGYDISDYTAVAPEYGTLDDFTAFIAAAHARNLRVVLDLVLNHSSDQHPWFIESRSSRDNPKRDWYVWRDGKSRGEGSQRRAGPPTNWPSIFGGSAWTYDAATGQYYYHAFLPQQPDLNWRNPALKQAMWDVVRFWLDLGVDGFRLDAIGTIFEHPDLPDQKLTLSPDEILDVNALARDDYFEVLRYQFRQPGLHELMKELRALVDTYPGDRVLIGEDEEAAFYGAGDELHLVFNFPLLRAERLTPAHVRANQAERLGELPPDAWPANTLGNHDGRRAWSRYGDEANDAALASVHATLLLTLKGTPFLYNGEEIGMADLELAALEELRDTSVIHQYHIMVERLGLAPAAALEAVLLTTRDRCRSPLHWDSTPNAGFSPADVRPWLPVHANFAEGVNVAAQAADPASLLNFYCTLLHLRRHTPALVAGDYTPLLPADANILAFVRHDPASGQRCLVALNFTPAEQRPALDFSLGKAHLRFSSHPRPAALHLDRLVLAPFECLVAELR